MKTEKPPYRVPTMTEIAKIKGTNGYDVVSTFSGCGGSCLGFEMAGFKVLWASEFIPAAQEVYRLNHPGVYLDTRDIREVQPEEIIDRIGKKPGEVDVLEGSPPCSSFSTAGKRSAGWGEVRKYSDKKQRTDDLFFEFARILEGLQPKIFVAENVAGLVKGVAKGYFLDILARLKDCGYHVEARVLDAQWLGVPQARKRLIFIGRRDGDAILFPPPMAYRYSTDEGLQGLDPYEDPEADISAYAIGKEWEKLRPGSKSTKYLNLVRSDHRKPFPTVTVVSDGGFLSAAKAVHGKEKRNLYLDELKRICGFPDDFLFGSLGYKKKYERLGRAVPPVMMKHIAESVRTMLDEEKK